MTSQALSLEKQAPAESTSGFHPFRAMAEGLRRRREHAEAESLLRSCVEKGIGGGEDFKGALERFKGAGPQRQGRILEAVGRMLSEYSEYEFASERNIAAVTTLTVFATEAAALMPKQADGTPAFGDQSLLKGRLGQILATQESYVPVDPLHANAKLAAAVALWEFGQRELKALIPYMRLPVVGDFVISQMLNDTGAADFSGSGWYLLRGQIDTPLALAIASSRNPKRYDFVASMMLDENPNVASRALEAAVYLNPLPAEFLEMAAELAGRSEELNYKANCFISVVRIRPLLEAADDAQFFAATQLLMLYREGMGHLGPMLVGVGMEMKDVFITPGGQTAEEQELQRAKAGDVLRQMHASGIPLPGVNFVEEKR